MEKKIMAYHTLTSYQAYWRPERGYGVITAYYADTFKQQTISSASEMAMIMDLLRNEKPVYISDSTWAFTTSNEPVGEEET